MDVSDGLSLDLHRLCEASRVAAEIDREPPCWPGVSPDDAIHDGEDYELLFTAGPDTKIPTFWRGLPLTRIGVIRRGGRDRVRMRGKPLAPRGYDHLAGRS